MAEDPGESSGGGGGGGGAKVGIGAVLVAALAGVGRFADDCGRVGATSAAHFGDDAVRGAGRLGGVGNDVGRAGLNVGDDALRAGRGATALEAGSHVRLGEGQLANVVDDVAPGAGKSVEEAFAETGADLAFEVVTLDLPESEEQGADVVSRSSSPRVVFGASGELPRAGELVVIVGEADAEGSILLANKRVTDAQVHVRCAEAGARCVVVTCDGSDSTCPSLALGMGRMAASRVSPSDPLNKRYAELVYGILERRRALGVEEVQVSRVEAKADKIVRSSSRLIEKRR